MKNSSRKRRGFTLIELIVVVAIIGVLGGVATLTFGSARARSKVREAQSDIAKAVVDYETYKAARFTLPDGVKNASVWSSFWQTVSITAPTPPDSSFTYSVSTDATGKKYVFCAQDSSTAVEGVTGKAVWVGKDGDTFAADSCPAP